MQMNYWLFKSEPSSWSWQNQQKTGKKEKVGMEFGIIKALNNMKKMKLGDLGFFYHSVTEKRIVGIVEVIKEYHPDPTDNTKSLVWLELKL